MQGNNLREENIVCFSAELLWNYVQNTSTVLKITYNIICVSFSCKIPEVMQYLKLLLKFTYSITISLFPDLLSPYSSVPNLFICRKI